jgi:hypothetical protein
MAEVFGCTYNGVEFWPIKGQRYMHDYVQIAHDIADGKVNPRQAYRELCQNDLWFLVFFVLKVSIAHDPFWIQACRDVQDGPVTNTLDLWARDHGKTTIISTADTIRALLRDREERIGIFSYAKTPALKILSNIKLILETSEFLKCYFDDVLYQDPKTEAHKWSEDVGLYVRRSGFYREPSLSAYGLIEGMPTGSHFSLRIYDDVVTQDLVSTPEAMQRVKDMFDVSQSLGTKDGRHRVIGTPYHHDDAIAYIEHKRFPDGTPVYEVRRKTATIDGTPNGPSAYLPESRLAEMRVRPDMFFCQYLLDPTPHGTQKLNFEELKEVSASEIPEGLWKFMVIDPAGVRTVRANAADSWGIHVVGVEPFRDDLGASSIYILDSVIEPMPLKDALDEIVEMYLRNGRIVQVGVEKTSLSTMEIHVSQALHSRGKILTVENGTIKPLLTAGRKKEFRIEQALSWPLSNGKIHISKAVPVAYRERLKMEMQRFPFWHDDGIDALSYVFDLIKEYRFSSKAPQLPESHWDRVFREERRKTGGSGWMVV